MQPRLSMTAISKQFPGVQALSAVDFRLFSGEVHALMGENGAGKSTLIKVLTGVYPADAGTITLDGVPVRFTRPQQAQAAGVSAVFQEVNLCPNLSVAENIMLGRQPRRFGAIRWTSLRRRAIELLARFDLDLDVDAPLGSYSLAVQQLVAIVRAVDPAPAVLVLDEPTSSLDAGEVQRLFGIMRRLQGDGVAILFVSHFIDQIYEVSDRITVLRNGRGVGEYRTADLPRVDLVARMIGRSITALAELDDRRKHAATATEPLVLAQRLGRHGGIEPFTLAIGAGEVVGLAGLLGSGRTELARLLAGADRADTGRVLIDGQPATLRTPRAAIGRGVALCPENRRTEGLVADLSVRENIVLALQAARGWTRPVPVRQRDELVARYIDALRISPASPTTLVRDLSGGNQQKVLLARWLITRPRLLILDEPTRGIDVGAKAEIQQLVIDLATDGVAVLFVSAELEEVLRLSHRIAVLRDRRLIGELTEPGQQTPEHVMATIAEGAAP